MQAMRRSAVTARVPLAALFRTGRGPSRALSAQAAAAVEEAKEPEPDLAIGSALMDALKPHEIVQKLDDYIVGQPDAKRAVAIAMRNRWRRHQLPDDLKTEVRGASEPPPPLPRTPKPLPPALSAHGNPHPPAHASTHLQPPSARARRISLPFDGRGGRHPLLSTPSTRGHEGAHLTLATCRATPHPVRSQVVPKNILMIGPTGCGKTEIARRIAKLSQAPFLKVEATKFTEVGFHGRDVDQIIRDLVEVSLTLTKKKQAEILLPQVLPTPAPTPSPPCHRHRHYQRHRRIGHQLRHQLRHQPRCRCRRRRYSRNRTDTAVAAMTNMVVAVALAAPPSPPPPTLPLPLPLDHRSSAWRKTVFLRF